MICRERAGQVLWLLSAPVLETMDGCRKSIEHMNLRDVFSLCQIGGCTAETLPNFMYRRAQWLRSVFNIRRLWTAGGSGREFVR